MILYHGYAVRWLHPAYRHEAVIIDDRPTFSAGPTRASEAVEKPDMPGIAGEQLTLMPLPEVSEPSLIGRNKSGGRKKTGHAGISGQGPAGETCGSCEHYCRVDRGAGVYRKCALVKAHWTKGPGSDIRKGDPACGRWGVKAGSTSGERGHE